MMLARVGVAIFTVILATPLTGQAPTSHDSTEAAVIRLVLDSAVKQPQTAIAVTPSRNFFCASIPSKACAPLQAVEWTGAWTVYTAESKKGELFAVDLLKLTGRDVVTDPAAAYARGNCTSPAMLHFSRVAFDSTMQHAIVDWTYSVGKGPKPGCGFSTGSTAGLTRRSDGTWAISFKAGNWIT